MKLEETLEIVKQERFDILRKPKNAENVLEDELDACADLLIDLKLFLQDQKILGLVGRLATLLNLRKTAGVNKISGFGTIKNPYKIKSIFGEGEFYDVRKGFKDNKYPDWIKQNYCHDNCINFAFSSKGDCKILSGIACVVEPFLHSVILVDDKILDFNYHLAMSKDLYFALTKFECLEELDAHHVLEGCEFLNSKEEIITRTNMSTKMLVFAFDDVLKRLDSEYGQQELLEMEID